MTNGFGSLGGICYIPDNSRIFQTIPEFSSKIEPELHYQMIQERKERILKLEQDLRTALKKLDKAKFSKFLDENPHLKKGVSGMKKDAIYLLKEKLNELAKVIEEGGKIFKSREDIFDLIDTVERLCLCIAIFRREKEDPFKDKSEDKESEVVNIEKMPPDEKALRHEWFLYFLYATDRTDRRLKLARTILKVFTNLSVEMTNLVEAQSEDYYGKCWQIQKSSVWCFDLTNKPRPQATRELHFKVDYPNKKYEILFGAYTTYDQKNIYSGSLVLEKITEKVLERVKSKEKTDTLAPLKFFFADESREKFDALPEAIQNFLAVKSENFYRVPAPY